MDTGYKTSLAAGYISSKVLVFFLSYGVSRSVRKTLDLSNFVCLKLKCKLSVSEFCFFV